MTTPRIPKSMRDRLAEAITTLDRGPSMTLDRALFGESEQFMEGRRDTHRRYKQWSDHNVRLLLSQVLSWADGQETAHAIDTFEHGTEYRP